MNLKNTPMEKEINCLNWRGLIAFIRKQYGEEGVNRVTQGLINNPAYLVQDAYDPSRQFPIFERQLTDPSYWVSNEFSLALFENVRKLMGEPNPLYRAGAGAVRENLSRSALFAGRIFGPGYLAKQAGRLNARMNKTKDLILTELSNHSARLKVHYKPEFRVTKDVCNWNLGIYTELARLAGARHVKGTEVECVLKGDACCTFSLEWKPVGWLRRIMSGILAWFLHWDIQELISEYETTVRERDLLIDTLAVSEKKYRTLFEDSMEAMCLTHGGKIVDTNPAWLNMHGYENKDEVLGADIIGFIHPEDRQILSQRRQTWPELRGRLYRMRDIRKDGTSVDVELYSSGITLGDQHMILATIRDITDVKKTETLQKELENRLQRARKMEAIGTLASGVAHDLNNILSGIVTYPGYILMNLPEDSPIRKPIETMQETGKKAAVIVQDLLTLARKNVSINKVVNLNTVAADYFESPEFDKLMKYHPEIKVDVHLENSLLNIMGSSVHLTKALMNLVSNAAEAMPDGGKVTVSTENRYIDKSVSGFEDLAEGDYALLKVSDTGIGIPEGETDRVFEPFYTRKKTGKSGTGLGMAVVWGTIKDHKGHVDLQSAPGKGTTFTIFFPVTRNMLEREVASPSFEEFHGRGETILVVDDVSTQREIAKSILTDLGYNVATAPSGEAALAYLEKRPVDLMILDMIMSPGINGLETYERIIKMHPGQKAIITSGYSDQPSFDRARELGVGQYITKPFTVEKFGRAVKQELEK